MRKEQFTDKQGASIPTIWVLFAVSWAADIHNDVSIESLTEEFEYALSWNDKHNELFK